MRLSLLRYVRFLLVFALPPISFAQSDQIQRLPTVRQKRVYSLLDQIQNAWSEGDVAAIKACNAAIAEFPQIGQFYLRRGNAYESNGDDKERLPIIITLGNATTV